VPADRQFAGNDGLLSSTSEFKDMRNAADDRLGRCALSFRRRLRCPCPKPFDEELAVGIEHDLDDAGIIERDA
jgi:hypothetical protein